MSTLQTKITKIDYDKNTKEIALKLKELIDRNPLIFQMILTEYKGISFTDKRGYFNIIKDGSVEATLTKKIISVLDQEYQKDAKNNNDQQIELAVLKYAFVERTNSFDLYTISKLPENMIYYYMAYLKYKRDLNEHELYINVLTQTKEKQNALFNELHQRQGITLYNLLLQEQVFLLLGLVQGIKPLDIFLANNIREVTELVYDAFTKKLLESSLENKEPVELTKISFKEYDDLCKEYLIRIDPSLKWLKSYLLAQEAGNIIYTEETAKWETLKKEGKNYLRAPLRGNIEDVVSTIHEFSHYMSIENITDVETIPRTLLEFPALFFEENVYSFLQEKGISPIEIETLRKQRERWTEENSFAVLPYLNYLKEFITEGPITKAKIKSYLDRINFSLEESIDIMEQVGTNVPDTVLKEDKDLKELINTECLIRNSFLIRRNDVLLEYPYVIGTYLASVANDLIKTDPLIIPDILNYTENLSEISPKVILERLSIPLKQQDNKSLEPKNMYQKKKKD